MTPHAHQGQDADKCGLLERFLVAKGVADVAAGGDLCSAIECDADGELKWHRDGHHIALDIAKGLYFLHSHDVRLYLDTTKFPIHQHIRMLLDSICCATGRAYKQRVVMLLCAPPGASQRCWRRPIQQPSLHCDNR
jgi:hypothetical protein